MFRCGERRATIAIRQHRLDRASRSRRRIASHPETDVRHHLADDGCIGIGIEGHDKRHRADPPGLRPDQRTAIVDIGPAHTNLAGTHPGIKELDSVVHTGIGTDRDGQRPSIEVRGVEVAHVRQGIDHHRQRPFSEVFVPFPERQYRHIVGRLYIDKLGLRRGGTAITIRQTNRERACRGGGIVTDILELDAPIDFLNGRRRRAGIERDDQGIGPAGPATDGANHRSSIGDVTTRDSHLAWTSAPVPHHQSIIGGSIGRNRDGHHAAIDIRRIHIGDRAGRIDQLCRAPFDKRDIRGNGCDHWCIVHRRNRDINGIGRTGEGRGAAITGCTHLRARRAAGLIPGS